MPTGAPPSNWPFRNSLEVPVSSTPRIARCARALVVAIAAVLVFAPFAAAQQPAGFLFKRPVASLSIRAGYSIPTANSEIFQFIQDSLTVATNAFNAFAVGGDLSVRVTERIDVGVSLAYSSAETRSEFRNWVDFDELPIEQDTRLARLPVTAQVRAYLFDRGRSIGQFAWIPSRWSPYVGVGGGAMWYQFEQTGEFVDFATVDDPEGADIFRDTFLSEGWTPTVAGFAGAEVSLSTRFVLSGEARYSWAKDAMGAQFSGFDEIDLAGLQFTLGMSVRF